MGNDSKMNYRPSVMKAVLKAFIPYSKENIMLSFKPGKFFHYLDELQKQTGASKNTISVTINRAKRSGLLMVDPLTDNLITTWKGKIKAGHRTDKRTDDHLVIIFDIPENYRGQRNLFRQYLAATGAEPVQKSVWKTRYDIHDELNQVIGDLGLGDYVKQFIAKEL